MGTLYSDEQDDTFYLHIVIQKEVRKYEGDCVLDVHLNLKNIAVTSTGSFHDGGELLWGQNHNFRVRQSFQDKGTRSAKQALARLSRREKRFVLDRLHTISRRIVEEYHKYDCSYIAVEDLSHIGEPMDAYDVLLKRQMHQWAFRELPEMIRWLSAEYAIRVEDVNPAFSSQTCSKCRYQSSTNCDSDGWSECNECGYEIDSDYNAPRNIGKRLLSLLEGKRLSGLGNGHLALKSGTLNLNGDYTAYNNLSAEGESHAQAHGFSRG